MKEIIKNRIERKRSKLIKVENKLKNIDNLNLTQDKKEKFKDKYIKEKCDLLIEIEYLENMLK
jgi:hypothetical protein